MKSREELGQIVMAVFHKVDPSDVKKLTGDFGKVFRKNCAGKTKEDIGRWRQALAKVATIAGYHSSNWENEAAMIEKITTDISNKLNHSTSLGDFDGLVGMKAHLEKMEPLLCIDSHEVRMIGILGPSGIGKTTIARVAYSQLSNTFQLSVFMENIKEKYTRYFSDDYSAKLHLQQQFLSQITNQKDIEILHLGVAKDRLKDKKVLVVLDGVDHSIHLDAMAKETWWFGPGSRIIITSQYQNIFRVHGINHIYMVDFPPGDEALQILCMYAFGQKFPKDGFEELAGEVTYLAGKLPLGLRVMGSYFRRMSKQEWRNALPKLRTSINTEIESILKFSYDALDDEDKDLFLYIACVFNLTKIKEVEEHLAKKFLDVKQGIKVLAEKSLISINSGQIEMHNLLVLLGRDIVRKQSVCEPGRRQFLVDKREICELLTDDAAGTRSVIGINFHFSWIKDKLYISETAFKGMSNLQFIKFYGNPNTLYIPFGLDYLSRKLRLLHWRCFPMTCLPSTVNLEFLVEIYMQFSKLEKLWEGIKPLRNLKWVDLRFSEKLKELPDLSTATNLEKLNLSKCSSLINLPSSIGNATNLKKLDLSDCSSLVKIPSSLRNATNLEKLCLDRCSSLVEIPSSIGNATNLQKLGLSCLSCLVEFPSWIGYATNLKELRLSHCSNLLELPVSIGNLQKLQKLRLEGCSKLEILPINIKEFPHALHMLTEMHLSDAKIQEIPPCFKRSSCLKHLMIKGCKKLVSLPQIPDSLSLLDAEDCESLETLDCSFHDPNIRLIFAKCFKLNQEARDLIIQTPSSEFAVLPGRNVPAYFTDRAIGSSLTIKLNESPLPTSMRFKVCILLVEKGDDEAGNDNDMMEGLEFFIFTFRKTELPLYPILTEHLYTFEVKAEVTSSELVFEFKVDYTSLKIGECGIVQLISDAPVSKSSSKQNDDYVSATSEKSSMGHKETSPIRIPASEKGKTKMYSENEGLSTLCAEAPTPKNREPATEEDKSRARTNQSKSSSTKITLHNRFQVLDSQDEF